MKKSQYDKIIQHIEETYNTGYRLRFDLGDRWVQGVPQLLGTDVLVVMQDNKQPAYVDLGSVITITVG